MNANVGVHPTARAEDSLKPAQASGRRVRFRYRRGLISLARAAVIVGGIGLAVVIPMGWGEWSSRRADQMTDNAYIQADTTPISAQVAGRLRKLLVQDYQHVAAGDLLAEIDDSDYQAEVAKAVAAVSSAKAAIANIDSRVELQRRVIVQTQAGADAAKADLDQAASEFKRQQSLASSGISTAQKLETATADIRRLQAQLAGKNAEVAAQRQQLDVLKTEREQAEAELQSREADVTLAQIALQRTQIRSPINGVISASNVREGQLLSVGTRLISVVPLPAVFIEANYKETQLSRVEPGQSVTFTVDALPDRLFTGHVERISPASGAEFALLPADNSTGNFTKVAQRITVRIAVDARPEIMALLRPGMSVVSTIHTASAATGQE